MIEFQSFQPLLGERKFLSPFTATVHAGVFAVLSAPSGAGKSRLLETISSSDFPRVGTCLIGAPLASVPQTLDLCRGLTAAENVASARASALPLWRSLLGFPISELERARALLREVGLEATEQPTYRLSGGEQQRVALARLLNSERRVWLLDEPVSQLDDRAAIACMAFVKREAQKRGAAVLCVLHQKNITDAVADVVYEWDGRWKIV